MCLSSAVVFGLSWSRLTEEPFLNAIMFVLLSICRYLYQKTTPKCSKIQDGPDLA